MNRIPAGITDNNIEFFHSVEGIKAFVGGKIEEWNTMPPRVIDLIRKDLHRHPEALDRLAHLPDDEQLRCYVKCKWGAMGSDQPDLTASGESNAEYWCDCQECPLKPVLRGKLKVTNGYLSEREVEVARLIALGRLGKEISAELGISESTINSHKRAIFEKAGITSNVELTTWANRINLI